jgi:hypothetical protein
MRPPGHRKSKPAGFAADGLFQQNASWSELGRRAARLTLAASPLKAAIAASRVAS